MSQYRTAHVLVVDDEPELRELLVDALSDGDMEISAAANGKEAIDLVTRGNIDFIVTDLCLPDCTGLDILDELSELHEEIPSVVITGHGDAKIFSEASRRRPVELMTKPLDVDRLRSAIREGLSRRANSSHLRLRTQRLRRVANRINRQRKTITRQLETTCAELTDAYRGLSGQLSIQKVLLSYQNELIAASSDDGVFRTLFRLFVQQSGAVFGISLICNASDELQIVGRFGVPQPDSLRFCQLLSRPLVSAVLAEGQAVLLDLSDQHDLFDQSIHRYLPGINALAAPLVDTTAEMAGLAILYRKGEQPFTEADLCLAESISAPTAVALGRIG